MSLLLFVVWCVFLIVCGTMLVVEVCCLLLRVVVVGVVAVVCRLLMVGVRCSLRVAGCLRYALWSVLCC